MTSLFCSVLAVMVALGPVNHLRLPRWIRIAVGLFLLTLAQHYLLHRLFHASILSPDMVPTPLLGLFLWGEAFLLSAAPLTIFWWLLRLCRKPTPALAPLILAVIGAFVMLWLGLRQPPVRERTVVLPGLPTEAEGLRVAVIADLHIDHWRGRDWCARFTARVNAQHPDLILFTGDQADGAVALRKQDLAPLRALQASAGKFIISGNHEYYFETEAYLKFYETLGLTVLDGRTALTRGLGLMGLPDTRSLTRTNNLPTLRRLIAELPPEALPVLLVHKPGIAPEADTLGVRLQLSGHTHGGQLPGVDLLIAHFNRGFVRGWYSLTRGMRLFVAPGCGVWLGFPFRLYPSEITLLTLHGSKPENAESP